MKGYDQRVTNPDNWLTHLNDGEGEEQRQFVKVIHLPEGQAWDEVTDEYYQEWKEKYQPEPEQEVEYPEGSGTYMTKAQAITAEALKNRAQLFKVRLGCQVSSNFADITKPAVPNFNGEVKPIKANGAAGGGGGNGGGNNPDDGMLG